MQTSEIINLITIDITILAIIVALFLGIRGMQQNKKILKQQERFFYETNKPQLRIVYKQVGKRHVLYLKNYGKTAAFITNMKWANKKPLLKRHIMNKPNAWKNPDQALFYTAINQELAPNQKIYYMFNNEHTDFDASSPYKLKIIYNDYYATNHEIVLNIDFDSNKSEGSSLGAVIKNKSEYSLKDVSSEISKNLVQSMQELTDTINDK